MRRAFIFLCGLLCGLVCIAANSPYPQTPARGVNVPAGGAGITFESVSAVGSYHNLDNTSPKVFNHTVAALTDGYIIICVAYGNAARSNTAVSFDAVAATLLKDESHLGDNLHSALWGIAVGNKGAGTYTISMDFNGTGTMDVSAASLSFNGVHQSASTGTAVSAQGTSTAATVNASSATGEVVVDCVASDRNFTVGASQTSRWERDSGGDFDVGGGGSTEPGAGTVTMSWTISASRNWTTTAVPLKPS